MNNTIQIYYHTPDIDILSKAKNSSIGNYGVFYKGINAYDMIYCNAEEIIPLSFGRYSRVDYKEVEHNPETIIYDVNGRERIDRRQLNYADNLIDFGDGLLNLRIGEEIDLKKLLRVLNNEEIFKFFEIEGYDLHRESLGGRINICINMKDGIPKEWVVECQ